MKVLETLWFTNYTTTGVIVAENEAGERHVYIGTGTGINSVADQTHILERGTKVRLEEFVQNIAKHIKK